MCEGTHWELPLPSLQVTLAHLSAGNGVPASGRLLRHQMQSVLSLSM